MLKSQNLSSQKNQDSFSHEFSSNILLGGNILTQDKLYIDDTGVTYIKPEIIAGTIDPASIKFFCGL